jgi:hypothetical protein
MGWQQRGSHWVDPVPPGSNQNVLVGICALCQVEKTRNAVQICALFQVEKARKRIHVEDMARERLEDSN